MRRRRRAGSDYSSRVSHCRRRWSFNLKLCGEDPLDESGSDYHIGLNSENLSLLAASGRLPSVALRCATERRPWLAFAEVRRYIARLQSAAGRASGAIRACLAAANIGKGQEMPKLKTKSGAKKRFGRTANGKIKRNWGYKRHRLISKSKQQKRLHRGTTTLETGDAKLVLTYMPYLRS
jgi:large subunit ribosomal protein L35